MRWSVLVNEEQLASGVTAASSVWVFRRFVNLYAINNGPPFSLYKLIFHVGLCQVHIQGPFSLNYYAIYKNNRYNALPLFELKASPTWLLLFFLYLSLYLYPSLYISLSLSLSLSWSLSLSGSLSLLFSRSPVLLILVRLLIRSILWFKALPYAVRSKQINWNMCIQLKWRSHLFLKKPLSLCRVLHAIPL